MQVAKVCLETPSELLLGFCGACPNLSLDTLFADFKMIDSAAQKKYGNEKLENGYKHAFMLSMSDLNDDGKTSDGREQIHHFMMQIEGCARDAHPLEIEKMESTPPATTYYQLLSGETLKQAKNPNTNLKSSQDISRVEQESELKHLKSLFEKDLISKNVYEKRQQEILRKLDAS